MAANYEANNAKITADFIRRVEEMLEKGENPKWDSLLLGVDFKNVGTGSVLRGFVNQLFLAITAMGKGNDLRFITPGALKKFPNSHILKGSTGTPVWRPNIIERVDEKQAFAQHGQGWERLHPKYLPKKTALIGFIPYYAFNIRDTNLIELGIFPESEAVRENAIEPQSVKEFFSVIDFKKEEGIGRPHYRPSTDTVFIPPCSQFEKDYAWAKSFSHEMIHWTGAASRLNRNFDNFNNFSDEERGFEELVACIGSSFLLAHLGINSDELMENQASYIKSWLKDLGNNPEWIVKAAAVAAEAVSYLIKLNKEGVAKKPVQNLSTRDFEQVEVEEIMTA